MKPKTKSRLSKRCPVCGAPVGTPCVETIRLLIGEVKEVPEHPARYAKRIVARKQDPLMTALLDCHDAVAEVKSFFFNDIRNGDRKANKKLLAITKSMLRISETVLPRR